MQPLDRHQARARPTRTRRATWWRCRTRARCATTSRCFIHGFTETHLDALCHLPVAEGDDTWNGKRLDQYGMPVEHTGTVDFWRDGIVTRGVLYDIPRLRGTDFVEPGRAGARLGARRRRRRRRA